VLVRYIIQNGTINPTADGNWTFKPVAGATVTFESGPKARNFIKEVKGVNISDAGEGENGFAKFRITL
jgi:2',3'-cyclic-nucleotide 2'-phosphodiesterase/3'-nucleotidase